MTARGLRLARAGRAGTAVALAMLLPIALVGIESTPAVAAAARFTDPRGDAGGAPDITRVIVRNSVPTAPMRVTVVVRYVPDENVVVQHEVFYDTDASDPGPEYHFHVVPNSEDASLYRWVGGWGGHDGAKVSCAGLRVSADAYAGTPTRVSAPRTCLDSPRRVRVAAQAIDGYPPTVGSSPAAQDSDWAPRRHAVLVGRPRRLSRTAVDSHRPLLLRAG